MKAYSNFLRALASEANVQKVLSSSNSALSLWNWEKQKRVFANPGAEAAMLLDHTGMSDVELRR